MKTGLYILLFSLVFFSCTLDDEDDLNGVVVKTDRVSYAITDNIEIKIRNHTEADIIVGYRCGFNNLEMYYIKKEGSKWSDRKWFDYMNLKCMTIQKGIKPDSILTHKIAAIKFKKPGTYRLLIPYYSKEDISDMAISNSFDIK